MYFLHYWRSVGLVGHFFMCLIKNNLSRFARVIKALEFLEVCEAAAASLLLGSWKKVPKSYPEAIEIAAEKKVLLLFSDSHSTARESLNWMPRKRPLLNMLKWHPKIIKETNIASNQLLSSILAHRPSRVSLESTRKKKCLETKPSHLE